MIDKGTRQNMLYNYSACIMQYISLSRLSIYKPASSKILALCFYGLMLVALLNGCNSTPPLAESTPTLAKELTIYGWEGYMPQSVLDAFSAQYNVSINYETYTDAENAIEEIRQGKIFDVVVLDNVAIQISTKENLLSELDLRNLPNFSYVANDFRDLAFDPQNKYSVPFQWGTSGLLFRTDLNTQPPTHWTDLWNPAFKGKIGLWPSDRDAIGLTLKSLGYSYNSEDPDELAQAGDRLMQLTDKVILLDPLQASGVPALINNDAQIIFGWAYDMQAATDQDIETIRYIIPEEGTIIWMDNLTIPANSPNHYTAELFLNFILQPKVGAQIANEMYVAIPNEGAYTYINPEVLNDPLIFPTTEDQVAAEFYAPISPEAQKMYEKIWAEFTAALP